MATLQNTQTSQKIICRVNHTFGRDRETNLAFLTSPSASRNHAAIAWDGESWQVKDISLNGTYINEVRMPKGQYQPIYFGDKIHFGSLIDNMWEVSDLAPPITGLFPMNQGLAFIPLFDIEILPIEQPEVLIYLSEQSLWVCEINGKRKVLSAGDVVGNGQKRWQFIEGRPSTATISYLTSQPDDIKFNFSTSQDGERVSLNLLVDNKYINMGQRNHHYILLLLARQRLEDSEKGIHVSQQGWIDKKMLINMSGIMEQHINILIYRFRKQVDSLTSNATTLHQIIERRPGELRFAYSDICIEDGCSMAKSI